MKKLIAGLAILTAPALTRAQSEPNVQDDFSVDLLANPAAAAKIIDFIAEAAAQKPGVDQKDFVQYLTREHALSESGDFGDAQQIQSFGLFGKLKFNRFFSESLQKRRSVDVYLPRKYDKNRPEKYPVVYFLHGAGTDQFLYSLLFKLVLDYHILRKNIEPVVLVLPDGSAPPYRGSFYTNSELYGQFEDYVKHDVITYIEEKYNVRTDPAGRFMMGASMGGYGAMKIAARHPEMFRGVVSHSGPHDLSRIEELIPNLLAEYAPETIEYAFNPDAGRFSSLAFSMGGAFSPNLTDPFFVNLPLNTSAEIIPEIYAQWLTHSAARVVKNSPSFPNLAVYFDCGRQDELEVFRFNTAFADTLNDLGVAYRFEAFDGGHLNKLLFRLNVSLRFIDSVFTAPPAQFLTDVSENDNSILPQEFSVSQNYPNPFNPSTTIRYALPKSAHVRLGIYDVSGKLVAQLLDEKITAGNHAINWDAASAPSGMYFARFRAGDFLFTRKMLLVR